MPGMSWTTVEIPFKGNRMQDVLKTIDTTELCKQEWRPVGSGKSYGSGGMIDPKTGWACTVDIEWKLGTNLSFGITHEHYAQMEALMEETEESWCRAEDLPRFIREMLK